jgi:hypothetical protein
MSIARIVIAGLGSDCQFNPQRTLEKKSTRIGISDGELDKKPKGWIHAIDQALRGCFTLTKTTMSNPRLPAETLDRMVDYLHDTRDALRNCCLVSKSWVPRTRRHLFADIKFYTTKSLQSWKNVFPDPANSPARYTKTLTVRCG